MLPPHGVDQALDQMGPHVLKPDPANSSSLPGDGDAYGLHRVMAGHTSQESRSRSPHSPDRRSASPCAGASRLHPGAKERARAARDLVPPRPTEDARQRYRKSEGASVSFQILSGGLVVGIVSHRRDVTELADRLLAGIWAFLHSLAAWTHGSQPPRFEDGRHTLRPKMSVR